MDLKASFVFNFPVLEVLDLTYTPIRNILNDNISGESLFHPLLKIVLSKTGIIRLPSLFLFCFPFLETLDLSNNCINALPDFFAISFRARGDVFHNLKYLNLSDNAISMIPFSFWNNFPKLESLDLSKNNISILSPLTSILESLTILNISRNRISEISSNLLSELPNLETLDISGNFIHSYPSVFPVIPNRIKALIMFKAQKDKISRNSLKSYPPIKVVD